MLGMRMILRRSVNMPAIIINIIIIRTVAVAAAATSMMMMVVEMVIIHISIISRSGSALVIAPSVTATSPPRQRMRFVVKMTT